MDNAHRTDPQHDRSNEPDKKSTPVVTTFPPSDGCGPGSHKADDPQAADVGKDIANPEIGEGHVPREPDDQQNEKNERHLIVLPERGT